MEAGNPNTPQSQPADSGRNRNILIIILAAAVVLLAAGGVYLFFSKEEVIETAALEKQQLEMEIESLNQEISQMDRELVSSNQEKQELQNRLKELQDKISWAKVKIEKLIDQGKLAQAEVKKFRGKYEQLQYYNEKYREKIQELQEQIEILEAENTELRGQVQAQDSLNEELRTENIRKQQTIEKGSYLTVSAFEVTTITRGGREKDADDGPVLKARRTHTLKVCFDIIKNSIARKGERDIYLVLRNEAGGNVVLPKGSFEADGSSIQYSARTKVTYTGVGKGVCMNVAKPDEDYFDKGNHTVQIYTCEPGENRCYRLGDFMFRFK